MTKKISGERRFVEEQLRADAEIQLAESGNKTSTDRILHELQVHQIELEMQNESLRQTQIDLAKSRDRYLDLYDFAPVGYLTLSSLGMISEANLTFAGWLGKDRASLINQPISLHITPDYRDRWHTLLCNIRQHERKQIAEICFRGINDSHFFARLDCLCLQGDGAASTIRISVVNLGPISSVEQNFIDGENRYRTLYESMRDAFVITDLSGKLLRFNKPYQDMLGYSAAELQDKTYFDLTPEKWHAYQAQVIADEVLRHGESHVFEKELIRKDGAVFPAELKIVILKDRNGQPEGMWAVVRDISLRKEAETRLAASESRFRLAMGAISSAVYDWDLDTDQLVASEGVDELIGAPFSKKSNVRNWWPDFVHPEDFPALRTTIREAWKNRIARYQAVFRLRQKDGHWIHVANRAVIVYGGNGRAVRMVGSLTDISDRIAAEFALKRMNDTLEEQVIERSSELRMRLQELHESERFIRATLDAMGAAVCVIDEAGDIIFENKVWQGLKKLNADEAPRKGNYLPYCHCTPLDEQCAVNKKIEAAIGVMLSGKRKNFSLEHACGHSTEERWFSARLSRFRGAGPIRLVLAHEDITERKLAANAVKKAARNFQAMLKKRELAHAEHSKQLAREVHDQLGATLTMLKLGLATTKNNSALAPPLQTKMDGMIELAEMALKSVKRVSASLRPSMLDTLGLIAAVNWHAKEFSRMTGIDTEVATPDYLTLSAERGESTFRVIQEALTNIAKHANATKVDILLRKTKRHLIVTVNDNGTGLKAGSLDQVDSFGIIGMRERADYLRGSLSLDSLPTGGTRLTLNIPLEMTQNEQLS